MLSINSSRIKHRIAAIILAIAVIIIGPRLTRIWPSTVKIEYDLPAQITQLDVDYTLNGDAMLSARFGKSMTETEKIQHELKLQPGRYDVIFKLYDGDHSVSEITRTLLVPNEGMVRFQLNP